MFLEPERGSCERPERVGEPGDGRPSRKARMRLREKDRDPGLVRLRRHRQNQARASEGPGRRWVAASPGPLGLRARPRVGPSVKRSVGSQPGARGCSPSEPVSSSVQRWKARWFLPVHLQ